MKKGFLRKREKGQSLVEFVLVLPLFLLILMGIIDFGWLFYNYIGLENSARNAARIACVEYESVNYNADDKVPYVTKTYNPDFYDSYKEDFKQVAYDSNGIQYEYNEVTDIIDAASSTIPKSVSFDDIVISYSYDASMEGDYTDYILQKRNTGDVTVTVHGKMRVLTPVLGVFSDHMKLNLTAKSTYKVEKAPVDGE